MSKSEGRMPRVLKREFLDRVSVRSGVERDVVETVYESVEAEIISATRRDVAVVLIGFGRYYRQHHKGHTVQFGKDRVGDYSVLKFSSLRDINRHLDVPLSPEEHEQLAHIDAGVRLIEEKRREESEAAKLAAAELAKAAA